MTGKSTFTNRIRRDGGLLLVLAAYLLLSFGYNAASPIFEPPDESTHFRYVKYLLDHKQLPAIVDGPNRDELWGLHQPPLYFAISAVLFSPFDMIAPDDFLARNPHVNLGYATATGNKNVFIHTPAESFPWRGFPLVVHLMRLLSTFFGALTLVVVYRIGLDLFAGQRALALLAPALMTVHPEFVFITAAIHNEPLNIFLLAVGVWGGLRLIRDGASLKLAVLMGVVGGAIIITKMTGLIFLLLVPIAMLIAALRGHSAQKLWLFGAVVVLLTVLLGGWWYVFNWRTYGDPFQRGMYRDFYHDVQRAITFKQWFLGILQGEVSFWATFGWFNILVSPWMYIFYRWFVRLALVGLAVWSVKWLVRRRDGLLPPDIAPVLFLLTVPLASALILARLIATEGGIQGRQLLPMLPALALLLVIGYRQLLPARYFFRIAALVGVFMGVMTASMPLRVIASAYAPPPRLTAADIPADVKPLDYTFNGEVRLVGVKFPTEIRTGETVPLTVYWQVLQPIPVDYSIFVRFRLPTGETVGQLDTYPGMGTLSTRQLSPGNVIADRYFVTITPQAETLLPAVAQIFVGLYRYDQPGYPRPPAVDAAGNPVAETPTGRLKIVPHQWQSEQPSVPLRVQFADGISLAGYDSDCTVTHPTCTLTLFWQADGTPAADYQVFVQLWDSARQIAGFDAPPTGGRYPTRWWAAGETIADAHTLSLPANLPPGEFRLRVGLYRLDSGERLSAAENGVLLPNFAVDIPVSRR